MLGCCWVVDDFTQRIVQNYQWNFVQWNVKMDKKIRIYHNTSRNEHFKDPTNGIVTFIVESTEQFCLKMIVNYERMRMFFWS